MLAVSIRSRRSNIKRVSRKYRVKATYQVLPIATGQSFLKSNDPFATIDICRILPYWPHPLLEQVIIAHVGQLMWSFEVRIYCPKILDLKR